MLADFDEDLQDGLTEIANIAIGQAAERIARSFSVFVQMPVPRVHLIESADISMAISAVTDSDRVTAVTQSFVGSELCGEALLLFTDASLEELARVMGYSEQSDDRGQVEIVMEMASLLSGSCIQGVAEQLAADVLVKHPRVLAQHAAVGEMLKPEQLQWERCLAIEFNCSFESYRVVCDLVLLLHEAVIPRLIEKITLLIE